MLINKQKKEKLTGMTSAEQAPLQILLDQQNQGSSNFAARQYTSLQLYQENYKGKKNNPCSMPDTSWIENIKNYRINITNSFLLWICNLTALLNQSTNSPSKIVKSLLHESSVCLCSGSIWIHTILCEASFFIAFFYCEELRKTYLKGSTEEKGKTR